MMFTMTFDLDNDAFKADAQAEFVRVMNHVTYYMQDAFLRPVTGPVEVKIRDLNGNTIGLARLTPRAIP